jgi:outer membrane protein OmpA-like peptidoglycan-associated protein
MRCIALAHPRGWAGLAASVLACLYPTALSAQAAEAEVVQGSAQLTATATSEGASDAPQEGVQADDDETRRAREIRAANTYYGTVGGLFVADAAAGAPKSFRLQLMSDFFVKKDYLYKNDKNRYVGSVLSLGITPIRYLEFNAAISTRSNRNSRTEPEVLQAVGDLSFGLKAWGEPKRGLALGLDARLGILSALDAVGTDSAATSVGLRGNLSLDLRDLTKKQVPMLLRLNGGYVFDNSAKLIEATERARLRNVREQTGSEVSARHEYRHLVRRDERFALGVDRVDHALIALGTELPLEVSNGFAIHPIAEYGIEIPVNRQDFDCPYIADATGKKVGGTDSCLGREGVDVLRSRVTVGARLYPVLPGLNLLAAVDIGVGGSTNFVQELAPNAPYRVMFAASYAADLQPKPPVIREVEKRVEVPVPPPTGRLRGRVLEKGDPLLIADAKIRFPGRELNPLLGNADGTFVTYAFDPGEIQLEIEAEGYHPGTCTGVIPPEGGEVALTCELEALPRVGSISGSVLAANGQPVANVAVLLNGPVTRSVVTDAQGRFNAADLPPGTYHARVETDGHLISVTPVTVKLREESALDVALTATPAQPSVRLNRDRIQLRSGVRFVAHTTEIASESHALLRELADFLMRHPELLEVEIQAHTDAEAGGQDPAVLTQGQAEALKSWLSDAGVERDRLVARGYGADKPLVPNVTEAGRARNRRVELVVLRRAGE